VGEAALALATLMVMVDEYDVNGWRWKL